MEERFSRVKREKVDGLVDGVVDGVAAQVLKWQNVKSKQLR